MVKAFEVKKSIFLSIVAAIFFLSVSGMASAADEQAEKPVDKAAKAAEEKEAKEKSAALREPPHWVAA